MSAPPNCQDFSAFQDEYGSRDSLKEAIKKAKDVHEVYIENNDDISQFCLSHKFLFVGTDKLPYPKGSDNPIDFRTFSAYYCINCGYIDYRRS